MKQYSIIGWLLVAHGTSLAMYIGVKKTAALTSQDIVSLQYVEDAHSLKKDCTRSCSSPTMDMGREIVCPLYHSLSDQRAQDVVQYKKDFIKLFADLNLVPAELDHLIFEYYDDYKILENGTLLPVLYSVAIASKLFKLIPCTDSQVVFQVIDVNTLHSTGFDLCLTEYRVCKNLLNKSFYELVADTPIAQALLKCAFPEACSGYVYKKMPGDGRYDSLKNTLMQLNCILKNSHTEPVAWNFPYVLHGQKKSSLYLCPYLTMQDFAQALSRAIQGFEFGLARDVFGEHAKIASELCVAYHQRHKKTFDTLRESSDNALIPFFYSVKYKEDFNVMCARLYGGVT